MALIELTGKYAVGEHRYATVDDDVYAYLSQWKWKAKPNGGRNNTYAVRNTLIDGKNTTIRMHREVLRIGGYAGMDVDHINHNALDNLRIVTRSENIKNARRKTAMGMCKYCEATVTKEVISRGATVCDECSKALKRERRRAREMLQGPPPSPKHRGHCTSPMFSQL